MASDGVGLAVRMASRSPGSALSRIAFGQLLDEQRHTIGAIDDFTDYLARKDSIPGQILDQRRTFGPAQPIEGQRRNIGPGAPGRLEFRAESHE